MLPKDVKARKAALNKESQQQLIDSHLQPLSEEKKKIKYSEKRFREAAIEWLIATDQVSYHPTNRLNGILTTYGLASQRHGPSKVQRND